jgi:hypothetical protein
MRSHLQRQTAAGVDVSGGIPVQHRFPRPVPLRRTWPLRAIPRCAPGRIISIRRICWPWA